MALNFTGFGPKLASFNLLNVAFHINPVKAGIDNAKKLSLRRKPLTNTSGLFSYLSCHTEASGFYGRDITLAALQTWAKRDNSLPVKFITGPGGAGKTKLAVELGLKLRKLGWEAGFLSLSKPNEVETYTLGKKGTLLIIDYPEEYPERVETLLKELGELDTGGAKLHLLFLTRGTQQEWMERLYSCGTSELVDEKFVGLEPITDPISAETAAKIYNSVQQSVIDHGRFAKIKTAFPVTAKQMQEWMGRDPLHRLPLFIVAAGLHSASMKKTPSALSFSGPKIVEMLVEREHKRLSNFSKALKADEHTLPRLLALSTISGGLPWKTVLGSEPLRTLCGIPNNWRAKKLLREAGCLSDDPSDPARKDLISPVLPDIVGAGFVVKVLAEADDQAPELIWEATRHAPKTSIANIARLTHDATYTLSLSLSPTYWISKAVDGNQKRCKALAFVFEETTQYSISQLPLIIGLSLDGTQQSDNERAIWLGNLGRCFLDIGNNVKALEVTEQALKLHRILATNDPDKYIIDLATTLNNIGGILRALDDPKEALKVTKEAVDIYHKLAPSSLSLYLPEFAACLSNMSVVLSDTGDPTAALNTAKEAINIFRTLVQLNSAQFLPDLALGLTNLGNRLRTAKEYMAALEATKEAVEIRKKITKDNPARFLPDLARSLGAKGLTLMALDRLPEAKAAFGEGMEILRPIAEQYPGAPLESLYLTLKRNHDAID